MTKWLNEVKFLAYLDKAIKLAKLIGVDTEGQSMEEAYRKFNKYFEKKGGKNGKSR